MDKELRGVDLSCVKPVVLALVIVLGIALFVQNTKFSSASDGPVLVVTGKPDNPGPAMFFSQGPGGTGLWYPGKSETRCLYISNQYRRDIILTNLGMDILLNKGGKAVSKQEDFFNEYVQSMQIEIYKDDLFKTKLFNGTFSTLMNGRELDNNVQIPRGKRVKLFYKVTMPEHTGNNFQDTKAVVDFTIALKEVPVVHKKRRHELEIPELQGHWAKEATLTLLKKGIITREDVSRLDEALTRAEVIDMIAEAIEPGFSAPPQLELPFTDKLLIPKCYYPAIWWAYKKGIIKGYGDGTFRYDATITRLEVLVMLLRASGTSVAKSFGAINLPFSDVNSIKWGLEYILEAYRQKLIEGYLDGSLRPDKKLTRAEGYVIIYRYLQQFGGS